MPKEVVLDEKERGGTPLLPEGYGAPVRGFSRTAQNLGLRRLPCKAVPGCGADHTTGPEEDRRGDIPREAPREPAVRDTPTGPFGRRTCLPALAPRASGEADPVRTYRTVPSAGAGTPSRPTWRSSGSRAWKEDSTATSPWSTPSFPWVIRTVSRRRRSGRPSVRNLPGRER